MSTTLEAQTDVLDVMKGFGNTLIKFYLAKSESDITRDEYNSIVKINVAAVNLHAFPIEFSPTQKFLEKAGLTEICDFMPYLSKLELNQQNIDYNDIDLERCRVNYLGIDYVVKEKSRSSTFGDDYLYVVLGCHKK